MARIPDSFLNDLIAATDIVSVIGSAIKLKKSGAQFVGKCPFHADSTPSFSVEPSKKVYLCRGCGATGNVITFLSEHEGSGFREVVERLAKVANMTVPQSSAEDSAIQKQLDEIHAVLARAQTIYAEELKSNAEAMAYLAKRSVDASMIERFGIGWGGTMSSVLKKKMPDVSDALLIKAGLSRENEFDKGVSQDWMKYRITFPIRSATGKIIAFGGRSTMENAKPKYLNTPETLAFKKGNELYGYHEAVNSIRKKNVAVVTEGYLDVVVPSGLGIDNSVSPMGTALSPVAIARLFKVAETVIFCFDGDDAGRLASMKAMEYAAPMLDSRHSAKFALLPKGMDPDDFVLKHGVDAYQSFLDNAMPLSKYVIAEFAARNDMKSAEGRARFAADAMDIINRIEDTVLRAIIGDEVRLAAGIGIPVPGVNAPANAITPTPEPIRRRGFANMRAKAVQASIPANGSMAHKPTYPSNKPIPVIAPAEDAVMRPALQIMAIFIAEPAFAAFFEADWLMLVNATDEEIHAVEEMTTIVRDYNAQHNADNANPISPDMFQAAFKGEHLACYVDRAIALAKSKEGTDLQKEFSDTVERLSIKQARMKAMNLIARRKP